MKKMNWWTDVLKLVEERREEPFQWGGNDCVLFAADCVELMGNEDPAKDSRGKYKTETGAKRHLSSVYGDLYQAWDSKLERLENPNFVQRGDVIVFETELGPTSGIFWVGGAFAPTPEGVRLVPLRYSDILSAWRV